MNMPFFSFFKFFGICYYSQATEVKQEPLDDDLPGLPLLPAIPDAPAAEQQTAIKTESDNSPPAKVKKCALQELFADVFVVKVEPPRSMSDRAKAEVVGYKQEPGLPLNSNPLIWWKAHTHQYPLLSKLAKKYLGVPATSVASERVFSTAGDIVTAQRAALSPEHVDRLIFLKKNMKI